MLAYQHPAVCEMPAPQAGRSGAKNADGTITIPAGAVVRVRAELRKGGSIEVLWNGTWSSTHLQNVLDACRIDDVQKLHAALIRPPGRTEAASSSP